MTSGKGKTMDVSGCQAAGQGGVDVNRAQSSFGAEQFQRSVWCCNAPYFPSKTIWVTSLRKRSYDVPLPHLHDYFKTSWPSWNLLEPLVLPLHLLPYGGGSASLGKEKPSNGNPFNFLPPDLHLISASIFPFFLPMTVEKGLLGSYFIAQDSCRVTRRTV